MKSNIIKEKDYDQYYIPVSLTSLLHKKKQKYIFEELEQRHPCFTEAFCFDSKFKIINRKIFLDVIVMKKIALMEYKKHLFIPGLGLKLEKGKRRFYFSDNRWKIFLVVFILFSILLSIRLIEKNKSLRLQDSLINEEIVNEVVSENIKNSFSGDLGIDFLNVVKDENGIIKSFVWKIDGYKEDVKANLTHMFPESFNFEEDLESYSSELSPVTYNNSEPCFVFQASRKLQVMEFATNTEVGSFIKEIRNLIQKGGGILLEESYKPLRVKFNCHKNLAVLSNIAKLLEEKQIGVGELKIEYEGNQKFLVELTCTKKFPFSNGIPLNVIQNYSELFVSKEAGPVIRTKNIVNNEKNNNRKIGYIGYEDGRKLVFYKNENGKIEKIMED